MKVPETYEKEGLLKAIRGSIQTDSSLPSVGAMATYTFLLSSSDDLLGLRRTIIDAFMQNSLEARQSINWCRTAKRLAPICTRGDGNCLLHAVALHLWGVHDSDLQLRRLVHMALLNDDGAIKRRWKYECEKGSSDLPDGLHLSEMEWHKEWMEMLQTTFDSGESPAPSHFKSLEAVHIFVIANILKRPVIVYGDVVVRDLNGDTFCPNSIIGIYLPLLRLASECFHSPVLLGFSSGHFAPLLSLEDSQQEAVVAADALHVAPLVNCAFEPLGMRFLLSDEEAETSQLLHSYLDLDELPLASNDGVMDVLCARLQHKMLPAHLRAVLPELPGEVSQQQTANNARSRSPVECALPATAWSCHGRWGKDVRLGQDSGEYMMSMTGEPCRNPSCRFYSSTETYPYCHDCDDKLSLRPSSDGMSRQTGMDAEVRQVLEANEQWGSDAISERSRENAAKTDCSKVQVTAPKATLPARCGSSSTSGRIPANSRKYLSSAVVAELAPMSSSAQSVKLTQPPALVGCAFSGGSSGQFTSFLQTDKANPVVCCANKSVPADLGLQKVKEDQLSDTAADVRSTSSSQSPMSANCVHPKCTNEGYREIGGLCQECYEIICDAIDRKKQPAPTVHK